MIQGVQQALPAGQISVQPAVAIAAEGVPLGQFGRVDTGDMLWTPDGEPNRPESNVHPRDPGIPAKSPL
jgi:hypothetical protein